MSGIYRSDAGERAVLERYKIILSRWPVANEQLRIPTCQGETFVIASGPADAPPLLLMHGSLANSAAWIFDVPSWAAHFRVYAIDMIGEFGLSAPSRPPLASDAHVLWLDDVMKGLQLTHVSIAGVSLGGWLALDYATRRPDRVERLALMCPGGVGRQKNFRLKALPLMLLGKWGAQRVRRMVFGAPPPVIPPQVQFFVDSMALIFEHGRPRTEQLPIFSDDALKRLKIPVLAIVGGKDVLIDSGDTRRRLEQNVPGAAVIYLPEAGHVITGQNAQILEFLRQRKAA